MKQENPQQKTKRTFFYTLARFIFSFLSQVLFPVKFYNTHFIQQAEAPFILLSNHSSMLDPPVLSIAIKRYEVHFLGKHELNTNPLLRFIFVKLHMISVARHATDIAAMRASNQVLKNGQVLGIFPEGTRNTPENFMKDVQSGLSMLALRNKVPLMPAYIHKRIRLFRLNHVYFLPPIPYEDILADGLTKSAVDELTARYISVMLEARKEAEKLLKPKKHK